MRTESYSLSNAIADLMKVGTPRGFELEHSAQLARSLGPGLKASGTWIPGSAFSRAVTTSGASGMIPQRVQQLPGILGWSAVVNSGATLLGPLKDSNLTIYHDGNLPATQWLPESGSTVPADLTLPAAKLSPKRVSAQVVISKQLLIQATGTTTMDAFIASRMKVAFASQLDAACLYGTGPTNNQPTGVISATGSQSVTTASPPTWHDLALMRYLSINADVDRSTFGFIVNPAARFYLETTPRFTNAAASLWDVIRNETQVSLEVSDSRIFTGVWAYLCLAYWGGANDNGPAVDIVVDPFSLAPAGAVVVTGTAYVDVSIRWPSLFCYSGANVWPAPS